MYKACINSREPVTQESKAEKAYGANGKEKVLKLWYDKPAPTVHDDMSKFSWNEIDENDGWERWSLPLGNGYMGVNVFGRTETERLQITENSLSNPYPEGLNAFSAVFIDFNHKNPVSYTRELNINEAVARVKYDYNGVTYERTIFTSYPDKVMVIKITASQSGSLSFTLRPTIPYIKNYGSTPGDNKGKEGKVSAAGDTITLSGRMNYYSILFEGQFKVIPKGGTLTAENDQDNDNGIINVEGADSAVILVAVGTNYKLESRVFTEPDPAKKLEPYEDPHNKVSRMIDEASVKTYEELLQNHKNDYEELFSRVRFDLGGSSTSTTDQLLQEYKKGMHNPYLEELFFQYGRYLLICSSRKDTLPPNLQGIWNRYDSSPWSGGYWHNINLQMNYWPVFSTNLAELFECYADYFKAYKALAEANASTFIKDNFPEKLESDSAENGWTIGTGGWAYTIEGMKVTGHSGPGTGALTSKLFWEYYDFTRDRRILSETTYPAVSSMAKFLSKVVEPYDDKLLTKYSASPEQMTEGTFRPGGTYYRTVGCSFDQQMIYENHKDTLKAAEILGVNEPIVNIVKSQIDKLDPVQIGASGQIKEYREENYYGEIGEHDHRHISQLKALYPGSLINETTPAWMEAAKVTLDLRGDKSTGWAMAHRLNLWARTKNGNRAYTLYQNLLATGVLTNLWGSHPPFQIDANFGGTAGVSEMLLQSHEGYIAPLAAIPDAWHSGCYEGLVARGNFEVAAKWSMGQAEEFSILSKAGGKCRVKYCNLDKVSVKTSEGKSVYYLVENKDLICFDTEIGEEYIILLQ